MLFFCVPTPICRRSQPPLLYCTIFTYPRPFEQLRLLRQESHHIKEHSPLESTKITVQSISTHEAILIIAAQKSRISSRTCNRINSNIDTNNALHYCLFCFPCSSFWSCSFLQGTPHYHDGGGQPEVAPPTYTTTTQKQLPHQQRTSQPAGEEPFIIHAGAIQTHHRPPGKPHHLSVFLVLNTPPSHPTNHPAIQGGFLLSPIHDLKYFHTTVNSNIHNGDLTIQGPKDRCPQHLGAPRLH